MSSRNRNNKSVKFKSGLVVLPEIVGNPPYGIGGSISGASPPTTPTTCMKTTGGPVCPARYNDPRGDLIIKSREGRTFKVHMYSLAQESELVNDLFTTPTNSKTFNDQPVIELPAPSPVVLQILDYLTSAEDCRKTALKVDNKEDAVDLYAAADYLRCESLISAALDILAKRLPVIDRFVWAYEHGHNEPMLRAALQGLAGDMSFGTSRLDSNLARAAILRRMPEEYMNKICAETFAKSWAPSMSWLESPSKVNDFVKLFAPGDNMKGKI